jgi:hypothetical protein
MTLDPGTFGPWLTIILFAAFIIFMTKKRGWKWTQLLSGAMLLAVLYGQVPELPKTINDGLTGIVQDFSHHL